MSLSFFVSILFLFSTECDGKTFGQDCGKECGECVNDEQCHHINGTCLNGCDRGFQGHECNEGEVFSFMARCPYSLYEQFSLKQISGYFLYDIEYSKQRYVMWTCVVLTTIKYEFYAVRINKIISIKFRIHFFYLFLQILHTVVYWEKQFFCFMIKRWLHFYLFIVIFVIDFN